MSTGTKERSWLRLVYVATTLSNIAYLEREMSRADLRHLQTNLEGVTIILDVLSNPVNHAA